MVRGRNLGPMTSPSSPPALPVGTPVWLVRAVAFAFALVPTILAVAQPGSTFTTSASQAAIVLVGYLIAGLILVAHEVILEVRRYGWTKAALVGAEQSASAEIESLLPEVRILSAQAQPILNAVDTLGSHSDAINQLAGDVKDLQTRATTVVSSPVDKAAVKAALQEIITGAALAGTPIPSAAPVAAGPVMPANLATPVAPSA
jgi:hypothetical protein